MMSNYVALEQASETASALAVMLSPFANQISVCGSVRCGKAPGPGVGIDIVAIDAGGLRGYVDEMLNRNEIEKFVYGTQIEQDAKYCRFVWQGILFKLFLADVDNYGYIQWLRTGPSDANQYVMRQMMRWGAPFRAEGGHIRVGERIVSVGDESMWFKLLGMPWMGPSERTESRYRNYLARPKWLSVENLPFSSVNAPKQLGLF